MQSSLSSKRPISSGRPTPYLPWIKRLELSTKIQCDIKLLIINLTQFKREYLNQFGTKTRHIKNKNKVLIRGKHQIHFIPFFTSYFREFLIQKDCNRPWDTTPNRITLLEPRCTFCKRNTYSHHDSHTNYLLQPSKVEKNWDRKAQEGVNQ